MEFPTKGARLLHHYVRGRLDVGGNWSAMAEEATNRTGTTILRVSLYYWATGQRTPGVMFAAALERWTDGVVPLEAWGEADVPSAAERPPARASRAR